MKYLLLNQMWVLRIVQKKRKKHVGGWVKLDGEKKAMKNKI